MPDRTCGACTACCHTVPVQEIGVAAFEKCRHESGPPFMRAGCAIYPNRPISCRAWSCQWLLDPKWPAALRPDICGVVIDPTPDYIAADGRDLACVQAWAMPGYEDAWETNPDVARVVFAAGRQMMPILWRTKTPGGGQSARVLAADEKTGKIVASPNKPLGTPDIVTGAQRALRAIAVARARHE